MDIRSLAERPLWVESGQSCGSRDLSGLTCNYLVYPSFECLLCIWSGCFPRRPVAAHSGLHETARHACTKAVKAIFADQAFFVLPERVFHADNQRHAPVDRKSTRLNSSHGYISYAV